MSHALLLIQGNGFWFWNQMSLWNVSSALGILIVATGKHGQFVELAFDTDQKFFDFKINFLFEFMWNSSRLLIISRVRHVLYGDSRLIQLNWIMILKPNFFLGFLLGRERKD